MTLLEINLTDVLSETDPDDKVVVWAPVLREGPAGQLVGTRRKEIPLTDGVGSDEVVPGPLMVQVQCKAMRDMRPREVVVPEEGPVTLTDLLDSVGAFTYSPAVVGRVAQMRDDAEAARDVSMEAAAAAVAGTEDVTEAVTAAEGHATQTADDRRQTGEDRTQTGLDRQAAAQSATDAATSATTAEGHKTTVQTALAGARLYSGTGFPEGVVTAPVGSIYTDTLATNGAIRWIKTSGTGNTGWVVDSGRITRNVNSLLINGWVPDVSGWVTKLSRTIDTVEFLGYLSKVKGPATAAALCSVPEGFRPPLYLRAHGLASGTSHLTLHHMRINRTEIVLPEYASAPQSQLYFHASWRTDDPWPTILPGTPA